MEKEGNDDTTRADQNLSGTECHIIFQTGMVRLFWAFDSKPYGTGCWAERPLLRMCSDDENCAGSGTRNAPGSEGFKVTNQS